MKQKRALEITNKKSTNLPGTLSSNKNNLNIAHFYDLPIDVQEKIKTALNVTGLNLTEAHIIKGDLVFPQFYESSTSPNKINRAPIIGKIINQASIKTGYDATRNLNKINKNQQPKEKLNFEKIKLQAINLATFLNKNKEEIVNSLSGFECYNVAMDEINRAIDFLINLHENAEYFQEKAGSVTTFLPINQPLYAAICFGVVPSFMADTFMRVPVDMQEAFKKLDAVINFTQFAPQLSISYEDRNKFIEQRKAATQTVIFTGKPENGLAVKKLFKPDVLFILNGAGHNPVVITKTAKIDSAVESTLTVCLQNQGQDCAAPNAILVQNSKLEEFKSKLLEKIKSIEDCIGSYKDKKNIIGPNTRTDHVVKVATLLNKNREYCIYGGNINVVSGLIHPCILVKPLDMGPNLEEFFAPVITIQPYENDNDLAKYFEHPQYKPNAMYVSLFGDSEYIETLIEKGLHTKENIIRNSDLHKAERGFLPYGGMGWAASSIHYLGNVIHGATLPQRDIYMYKVKNCDAKININVTPVSQNTEKKLDMKFFDRKEDNQIEQQVAEQITSDTVDRSIAPGS